MAELLCSDVVQMWSDKMLQTVEINVEYLIDSTCCRHSKLFPLIFREETITGKLLLKLSGPNAERSWAAPQKEIR